MRQLLRPVDSTSPQATRAATLLLLIISAALVVVAATWMPDPGTATERLPNFFVPTLGNHGVLVEVTLASDRNPATEGAAGKSFG